VVDTSVAVKFYLPEEFMEEARRLRDTVDDGLVEMMAPSTIHPEF
jgi:predicted nucleic acid-binding protein